VVAVVVGLLVVVALAAQAAAVKVGTIALLMAVLELLTQGQAVAVQGRAGQQAETAGQEL